MRKAYSVEILRFILYYHHGIKYYDMLKIGKVIVMRCHPVENAALVNSNYGAGCFSIKNPSFT